MGSDERSISPNNGALISAFQSTCSVAKTTTLLESGSALQCKKRVFTELSLIFRSGCGISSCRNPSWASQIVIRMHSVTFADIQFHLWLKFKTNFSRKSSTETCRPSSHRGWLAVHPLAMESERRSSWLQCSARERSKSLVIYVSLIKIVKYLSYKEKH